MRKFSLRKTRKRCTSDLSRDPVTVSGKGPLPCEVRGQHDVHERTSPPIAARWTDVDGTRTIESMRSVAAP